MNTESRRSFCPRLRCDLVLASLHRSLMANKVRDNRQHPRVEANHVQHAAVVRISEGEAVAYRFAPRKKSLALVPRGSICF